MVDGEQDEDRERRDQRDEGQADLDGVAPEPRREGLDEHPDQRGAHDDEHRCDGGVVDLHGLEGRGQKGGHWALPEALVGAGSLTPTRSRVCFTAGLTRSRTGLG